MMPERSVKYLFLVPVLIIVVGACFIFIGINRGEVRVMFEKAVNICLECVGIG